MAGVDRAEVLAALARTQPNPALGASHARHGSVPPMTRAVEKEHSHTSSTVAVRGGGAPAPCFASRLARPRPARAAASSAAAAARPVGSFRPPSHQSRPPGLGGCNPDRKTRWSATSWAISAATVTASAAAAAAAEQAAASAAAAGAAPRRDGDRVSPSDVQAAVAATGATPPSPPPAATAWCGGLTERHRALLKSTLARERAAAARQGAASVRDAVVGGSGGHRGAQNEPEGDGGGEDVVYGGGDDGVKHQLEREMHEAEEALAAWHEERRWRHALLLREEMALDETGLCEVLSHFSNIYTEVGSVRWSSLTDTRRCSLDPRRARERTSECSRSSRDGRNRLASFPVAHDSWYPSRRQRSLFDPQVLRRADIDLEPRPGIDPLLERRLARSHSAADAMAPERLLAQAPVDRTGAGRAGLRRTASTARPCSSGGRAGGGVAHAPAAVLDMSSPGVVAVSVSVGVRRHERDRPRAKEHRAPYPTLRPAPNPAAARCIVRVQTPDVATAVAAAAAVVSPTSPPPSVLRQSQSPLRRRPTSAGATRSRNTADATSSAGVCEHRPEDSDSGVDGRGDRRKPPVWRPSSAGGKVGGAGPRGRVRERPQRFVRRYEAALW